MLLDNNIELKKKNSNFSYLTCYEIELFSKKKNSRKKFLKISNSYYVDQI